MISADRKLFEQALAVIKSVLDCDEDIDGLASVEKQINIRLAKSSQAPTAWVLRTGHGTKFSDGPECPSDIEWAGKLAWKPMYSEPPSQSQDALDAARLDWLDKQGYAYGFEDMHEGNRWEIWGGYSSLREAIDSAMKASKP